MLVASNNFVNRQYAEKMKGWIGMTKIGQLIQEDIYAAAEAAAEAADAAATERERKLAEARLAEERKLAEAKLEAERRAAVAAERKAAEARLAEERKQAEAKLAAERKAAAEAERKAAEVERKATAAALKFMLESDMPKERIIEFMQSTLVGAENAL
jgi:hypothetical protein